MTSWLTFNLTEFGTPMTVMVLMLATFLVVGCVACSMLPSGERKTSDDKHFE